MPIYYKQGGTWKNVGAPYVKQLGKWILPEEAYVKINGEWKLIFEEFAFDVETVGHSQNEDYAILQGELKDYEEFNADNTYFFDQSLDISSDITATAADQKSVAIGGSGDTCTVYRNGFSGSSGNPKQIGEIQTLVEPSEEIRGIDFTENYIAVAAERLYIYEENYKGKYELVQNAPFSIDVSDPAGRFTDLQFNKSDERLAVGTNGPLVYIYEGAPWTRTTKFGGSAISSSAVSVSWDETNNYLAVGGASGKFYRFEGSTLTNNPPTSTQELEGNGEVRVEYSSDGRLAVAGGAIDGGDLVTSIYSTGLSVNSTILGGTGDVDWDGQERLVNATEDGFVRIYDLSSGSPTEIESFDASVTYVSVAWDGNNEYIVAGISDVSASEKAEVYSTGVRTFFDWSKVGANLKYRQRAEGLETLGSFELELRGLESNQSYDFRAGGFSANGRMVVDKNVLTFTTEDVQVATNPATSVTSDSALLEGEVTTLSGTAGNADVSFIWGKEGKGYPNEVYAGPMSANNIGTFSESIQNLKRGQAYQFKAVARYGGVTEIASAKETFTTNDVTATFDASVSDPTNFGDVFIDSSVSGAETTTKTFEVRETSGTGSFQITGKNTTNGDFTVTNSVPITVNSGSSETISVDFSTGTDGLVYGELVLNLNADADKSELSVDLVGAGENTPTLAVDGNPKIYADTADGSTTYTGEVVLRETGEDREAVIDSIVGDNTSLSGTWTIKNVPSQIPAGGTGSFTVEWTSSGSENFDFDVNYDGAGLNGATLNGTVEGNASGNVEIAVDAEANGSRNTSYTYQGTVIEGTNPTRTVQFDVLGNPNGDYDVIEIDIPNGDVGDFTIQNAPSEVTDGDSNTSVTVSDGNPLSFDIEFDPSVTGNRSADLEITAADSTNVSNTPYTFGLSGEGLEASEILTVDNNGDDITELVFDKAIIGGNKEGEEATEEFEVRNATSDAVFSVSADSTTTADFEVSNSIAGASDIKQGIKKAFPELEFVPQPGNEYTQGEIVQSDPANGVYKQYEIDHNAAKGADPQVIELVGEVRVSELQYKLDLETGGEPTFNPDGSPAFSVGAAPGNPNSLQFKVINNNTDLSTEVSIFDATDESGGSPDDLLSLEIEKNDVLLAPGDEAIASVEFDPDTADDNGTTELIDVEWDNGNQSTQIQVEGVIDSIISVETVDADGSGGGDLTLDFGGVAEGDTRTLEVVVSETGTAENFDITSSSAVSSSQYAVTSNFNGGTGEMTNSVTVEAGKSETAQIQVSITDAADPSDPDPVRTGTFTFEHDAEFPISGGTSAPSVTIDLTTTALNPVDLEMTDSNTGSTPVNYAANYEDPDGNQTTEDSTGIEITELGLDADATIKSFTVTNSGDDGEFTLNDAIDYSDYDGSSGNNNPVPGGGSIVEPAVTFSPFDQSGDKNSRDYTITGSVQLTYEGPGVTEETTTVGLQGEVLRPAKAEVASTEPIKVDGKTGRLERNNYVGQSTQNNYEIKETNIKNPYNVDDIVVVKKNPGSGTQDSDAYKNLTTTTTPSVPSSEAIENGTTVDIGDGTTYGGDAVTGTFQFAPSSGGIYNHVIQVPHSAPLGEDPLEIQVSAIVISYVTGAETLTGSLTPVGSGNVEGEAEFGGVPEVCEQLRLTVDNADASDPDINASNVNVTTDLSGQIKSTTDPASSNEYIFTLEDGVSGTVNLNLEFQVDNQSPDIEVQIQGEDSGTVAGSFVDSL